MSDSMRRPISSKESHPSAISIRRKLPKALIISGNTEPLIFSKSSAGPWVLLIRSAISVTSNTGSTSSEILFSSPSDSSFLINSFVFFKGICK